MEKQNSFIRNFIKTKNFRKTIFLAGALLVILMVLAAVFLFGPFQAEQTIQNDAAASQMGESEAAEMISATGTESTKQPELASTESTEDALLEERELLPELSELYGQNPDLAGWISIEDTVIDYPVMFTPEDGEKYIYANFEGKFDVSGLPFIEDDCSMEPESDNVIIYGHNMKNGSMFASLMDYKKENYWKKHPVISFSTLYEDREYEIIAAFYDKVYYQHETCFKFYQFIDAEDEEHFEEAMTYYKKKALYDTGVTAEYGDHLLTLVTCAYHIENGRFVVVARAKNDLE